MPQLAFGILVLGIVPWFVFLLHESLKRRWSVEPEGEAGAWGWRPWVYAIFAPLVTCLLAWSVWRSPHVFERGFTGLLPDQAFLLDPDALRTLERTPLLLGSVVLSVSALYLLGYWFRGDGKKDQRRCPRCWYDLAPTPDLMRCPECGFEGTEESSFHRRKRSRPVLVFAVGVGSLAILAHKGPEIQMYGWTAIAPDTVLIVGQYFRSDGVFLERLHHRLQERSAGRDVVPISPDALAGWQWWLLARVAESSLRESDSASEDRAASSILINALPHTQIDAPSSLPDSIILAIERGISRSRRGWASNIQDGFSSAMFCAWLDGSDEVLVRSLLSRALTTEDQYAKQQFVWTALRWQGERGAILGDALEAIATMDDPRRFASYAGWMHDNNRATATDASRRVRPELRTIWQKVLRRSEPGFRIAAAGVLEDDWHRDPEVLKMLELALANETDARAQRALERAIAMLTRRLREAGDDVQP